MAFLNLVTGGAGFLGSHLVDALVGRGESVIIVDNLSTGNIRNISGALETGRATFLYADIGQSQSELDQLLKAVIAGRSISRVYHLASAVSQDACAAAPRETPTVNSLAAITLIEIALRHGARFLHVATSESYVFADPESGYGEVDTIGERAFYDDGELSGEASVSAAVHSRGLDGRLVRLFECYGPRMSATNGWLIPALHEAAISNAPFYVHGTGLQTLSMTFVDDAISLLLTVMDLPQVLPPVNVGSDEELTVLDIVNTFAGVAGVSLDVRFAAPRPGDLQRRRPDFTLARGIGWSPTVSLEDGLRKTIDWMRNASLNYV